MRVLHKNLVRAVLKAGFKIDEWKDHNHYRVINGDLVVSWIKQDDYAVAVHCGRLSDPKDSQTDYFPGYTPRTIKNALEHL